MYQLTVLERELILSALYVIAFFIDEMKNLENIGKL